MALFFDNYLIEYDEKANDKNTCAVYFSSNAIYYPDTVEAVENTIYKRNSFEWYTKRVKGVYKHIYGCRWMNYVITVARCGGNIAFQ